MEDTIAKESREQLEALNKAAKERNTVKMSEFRDYIGMFNEDYVKGLSGEESYNLGKSFTKRFSRRDPIIVVNDNDPDDTFTIPAQYCTTPLLNASSKTSGLLEKLEYALSLKNNVVDRVTPLVKDLMNEITALGGHDSLHEENKQYTEAMTDLRNKKSPKKSNTPVSGITMSKDTSGPASMKDLL